MYIGYKKYEKIVEDFEQEQKTSQEKFLETFAALAKREKLAKQHVEFILVYALHKYMVGLEWIGIDRSSHPIPYSTLEVVCVDRGLDIEKFATRVDEDSPLGGFLRAWLACDGKPGYGPVAFKFLIEYGWLKKINDTYAENHSYVSFANPTLEIQAQVAALEEICDLFCDKDIKQLRFTLGFRSYDVLSPSTLEKFEAIT